MVYSRGYHPLPKLSFLLALPVGTESLQESFDVEFYDVFSGEDLKQVLQTHMPQGIHIALVEEVRKDGKAPRLKESHYDLYLNGVEVSQQDLDSFLKSSSFPVYKSGKKGDRVVDARPLVKNMILRSNDRIDLVMSHGSGAELRPADLIKGVFHLSAQDLAQIRILKTKQILC